MPTYMYKIQPVRPEMLSAGSTADEARITGEPFEYLRQLRDDDHMRRITAQDPGAAQKLFRAEWHPYRIALLEPKNMRGRY